MMLRSAIRLDDPVVFMEPKKMYWTKAELDLDQLRAEFEEGWARVEDKKEHGEAWARAAVVREGTDVTLVSYGPSVPTCLAAAHAAAEEGLSVEVVDLRTVNPLDEDTMTASVAKTGRAVVVHEAARTLGMGAEIAAISSMRLLVVCASPPQISICSPVGKITTAPKPPLPGLPRQAPSV